MDYATRSGRDPDFRVRYRWIREQHGTAHQRAFQHMRSDFLYDGDDPTREGIHMIWPEFEVEIGTPLEEGDEVPPEGTATMWILDPELRSYHGARLAPGVRGFLVVGVRKIAEVEVLETFDLP
jgi:hypothetical protein